MLRVPLTCNSAVVALEHEPISNYSASCSFSTPNMVHKLSLKSLDLRRFIYRSFSAHLARRCSAKHLYLVTSETERACQDTFHLYSWQAQWWLVPTRCRDLGSLLPAAARFASTQSSVGYNSTAALVAVTIILLVHCIAYNRLAHHATSSRCESLSLFPLSAQTY